MNNQNQLAPAIVIVGGGVLGVSVAMLLRAKDIRVKLLVAERCDQTEPQTARPGFASAYPAASIIPHSISLAEAERELAFSLVVFENLKRRQLTECIRAQAHYELFKAEPQIPAYLEYLDRPEIFSPGHEELSRLTKIQGSALWGWQFRALFATAPTYFRFLYESFLKMGGSLESVDFLHPEDLSALEADSLVICAGMGTPDLLGREEEKFFEEGYLLQFEDLALKPSEIPVSYNFSPGAQAHPDGRGGGMDVYAYPRSDALILGGTRLPGVEKVDGTVVQQSYTGKTITVRDARGVEHVVPEAIIECNRDFVSHFLGKELHDSPSAVLKGWRYRGPTPDGGVVHAVEEIGSKPVVACYGLGGSGVTLSWGLAARIADQVCALIGHDSGYELLAEDPTQAAKEMVARLEAALA